MSFSTWVFWGLAAHVVIFYLHTEQSPVCAHAQLVPFQTLIEIHISSGIRDACGVEHDWSVEDDTVLLQRKKTASILTYFSLPALKVHCVIIEVTLCYSYSFQLCFFFFFQILYQIGKPQSQHHEYKLQYSTLTALSSMPPPILNSTVRPMMLTPSFPRMMALLSPLMFRSDVALLVIWNQWKCITFVNTKASILKGPQSI